MALFNNWRKYPQRQPKWKRYQISPEVALLVTFEGNWMSLSGEILRKLNAVCDALEALECDMQPEPGPQKEVSA